MLHRRETNNVLLQLSTEAHRVVKAFKELGVPSPPIITDDYARYIQHYPPLLKHIAQLIGDIRGQTLAPPTWRARCRVSEEGHQE